MALKWASASEVGGVDFPSAPPCHSGHQGAPLPRPRHRPLTCAAAHLAPPPEAGIRDRWDLGGSPASAGKSQGDAEDRRPPSLRQDTAVGRRRLGFGRVGPGGRRLGPWRLG